MQGRQYFHVLIVAPMRIDQMTFFAIILVLLLIFFQYKLWFETGGLRDVLHLKKQLALHIKENDKLKQRNESLRQQVGYLQANENAVETRARQELGMIKKDETFYHIVKQKQ